MKRPNQAAAVNAPVAPDSRSITLGGVSLSSDVGLASMNNVAASDRGEVIRLGALSLLIPPLGLLVQLAHAHTYSSTRYFLDNAVILHALESGPLAILCGEALITFSALLACRRFLTARWPTWALSFCFVAVWAFLAISAEAQTK